MDINKNMTLYLKGIAILLMLFHHLFAFPERMPDALFFDISWIEQKIAEFGKICVYMFLFLSGYGFSKSKYPNYRKILNKLWRFYLLFWLVFFPTVLYFHLNGIYTLESTRLILLNAFGIRSDIISEWWFIEPYVILTLLVPLVAKLKNSPILLLSLSALGFALALVLIRFDVDTNEIAVALTLLIQPAFIAGYLIGLPQSTKLMALPYVKQITLVASFAGLPLLVLYNHDSIFLIPFVSFFIYLLILLEKILPTLSIRFIAYCGQHSTFMWLTHTIYCYHLVPELIYAFDNKLLIFLLLIAISLITSVVLSVIHSQLNNIASLASGKKVVSS